MRPTSLQDQLIAVTKEALQQRRWSQAELARRLDISTKHVSMLLAGRSQGRLHMWDQIFRVLKVRVQVTKR